MIAKIICLSLVLREGAKRYTNVVNPFLQKTLPPIGKFTISCANVWECYKLPHALPFSVTTPNMFTHWALISY